MEGWTFSFEDEENWIHDVYDTKEKAIEEGLKFAKEENYNKFHLGEATQFTPWIDTDCVIDQVQEHTAEEGGEYAEGYLENINLEQYQDLDKALNEALAKWLEKYKLEPNFYTVDNTEIIEVENN